MSCNPLLPNNVDPIRLGAANRFFVNRSVGLGHSLIELLRRLSEIRYGSRIDLNPARITA